MRGNGSILQRRSNDGFVTLSFRGPTDSSWPGSARLGADRVIRSHLCLFGHFKCIVNLDPQVADGTLKFGVP